MPCVATVRRGLRCPLRHNLSDVPKLFLLPIGWEKVRMRGGGHPQFRCVNYFRSPPASHPTLSPSDGAREAFAAALDFGRCCAPGRRASESAKTSQKSGSLLPAFPSSRCRTTGRAPPGVDRRARIKPLDEPAGLVGIVALGDVLLDQRDRGLRIIIQRDAGERAGRIFRLLLEESNLPVRGERDGIVFFDLLEIAHVIDRQHRRIFLAAKFAELAPVFR